MSACASKFGAFEEGALVYCGLELDSPESSQFSKYLSSLNINPISQIDFWAEMQFAQKSANYPTF